MCTICRIACALRYLCLPKGSSYFSHVLLLVTRDQIILIQRRRVSHDVSVNPYFTPRRREPKSIRQFFRVKSRSGPARAAIWHISREGAIAASVTATHNLSRPRARSFRPRRFIHTRRLAVVLRCCRSRSLFVSASALTLIVRHFS
jgi:hypothetical protein